MMFLMAFLTIVGKKCHKKYIMLSYYPSPYWGVAQVRTPLLYNKPVISPFAHGRPCGDRTVTSLIFYLKLS